MSNATPCYDSSGNAPGSKNYNSSNVGPFSGVLGPIGALYISTTPTHGTGGFPISASTDAQIIGSTQGDTGGCAINWYWSNGDVNIAEGSPSRNIVGPGYIANFDVAYIPAADIFNNLTSSGYNGTSAYQTVQTFSSGPYAGKTRADSLYLCYHTSGCSPAVNDQMGLVGSNVLDNAAQRIRAESVSNGLSVYVYTIGLGNAPGGVDNTLLERVANDPSAPNYNSAQPVGKYVYSPTAAQLNQAFTQIASEVLRLSN
jgi:hypothetical protein